MGRRVEPDDRSFLKGSILLESAYRLAVALHHGRRRRGNTTIGHPLLVAKLLEREGFDEPVIAAALLHDVDGRPET